MVHRSIARLLSSGSLPRLGLEVAEQRSNASWYESCSFQLEKSGMKYSRISRAESAPRSASNSVHERIWSK
jgi:hypothetical protein